PSASERTMPTATVCRCFVRSLASRSRRHGFDDARDFVCLLVAHRIVHGMFMSWALECPLFIPGTSTRRAAALQTLMGQGEWPGPHQSDGELGTQWALPAPPRRKPPALSWLRISAFQSVQ